VCLMCVSSRSIIQEVSECGRETSILRRTWPTGAVASWKEKIYIQCLTGVTVIINRHTLRDSGAFSITTLEIVGAVYQCRRRNTLKDPNLQTYCCQHLKPRIPPDVCNAEVLVMLNRATIL